MEWIVKSSKASMKVALQSKVTPGRWQRASIGDNHYELQWQPMLSTIFIRKADSELERAIRVKGVQVGKDPDSLYFDTELSLDSSPHLSKSEQISSYIKAEVCLYTPGLEGKAKGQKQKPTKLRSPMVGKVLAVNVVQDEKVKKGQTLFIIEAMKMENKIKAPCDGYIEKLFVSANDQVHVNDELAQLKPEA